MNFFETTLFAAMIAAQTAFAATNVVRSAAEIHALPDTSFGTAM